MPRPCRPDTSGPSSKKRKPAVGKVVEDDGPAAVGRPRLTRKRKDPTDLSDGFLNRARIRTKDTKKRYTEAVNAFGEFVQRPDFVGMTLQQVDRALERFIEDLFRNGESDYVGRCALHGWIWMYPHLIPGGAARASDHFPLAKGALVGWTK